jgi:hypothetical protein
MADTQTYATHRKWVPLWHYVALPIALLNIAVALRGLKNGVTFDNVWVVLIGIAFFATAYLSRSQALVVQNRLIRLEERLRLKEVLPAAMHAHIAQLTTSQLIGLRFAPDAELPGLVEACVGGQLANAEAVKKAIKGWRPDTLRA